MAVGGQLSPCLQSGSGEEAMQTDLRPRGRRHLDTSVDTVVVDSGGTLEHSG